MWMELDNYYRGLLSDEQYLQMRRLLLALRDFHLNGASKLAEEHDAFTYHAERAAFFNRVIRVMQDGRVSTH